MELVKLFAVHRYSGDIFSYSGPSGILVLMESRIPLKPVLRGVKIDALSISYHEQTQRNRVCFFLIL